MDMLHLLARDATLGGTTYVILWMLLCYLSGALSVVVAGAFWMLRKLAENASVDAR